MILSFWTGEPAQLAASASALCDAVHKHELTLAVDVITLAEAVWVLQSFYGYGHRDIARVVQELISHPGMEAEDKEGLLTALHLFAEKNVDFADALVAVSMERRGLAEIFSFERHFDGLPGATRLIPGSVDQPE